MIRPVSVAYKRLPDERALRLAFDPIVIGLAFGPIVNCTYPCQTEANHELH
jgi:hypothetical protein